MILAQSDNTNKNLRREACLIKDYVEKKEKGKPAITTPTTSVKAFINIKMVVINNQKLSQIITVAAPGPWSKLKL